MARHAKTISQGNTATEHLSVGVLSLCYPLPAVRAVVEECGKADQRVRDLPAALVVYYVIGLSLFPGVAYRSVLRCARTSAIPKPAAATDEAPNEVSSRSGGPNSRSESKAPNPPPENAIPPS